MKKIHIAIGNDHAGTDYKFEIIKMLEDEAIASNFGTDSRDSVDYPDYVHPLAESVAAGKNVFGILICGSGNGVCMTANKHRGVRAALCWNSEIAILARQHNNANVICIPARFVSIDVAKEMVRNFLDTSFEGGRHQNRVEKISKF